MKRLILDELMKWKESKRRKPLILKGARQVGKTWILQEFGKTFEDGYVYINFDRNDEYKQFFQTTKDPKRIIRNLSLASGQRITESTLIIFDEIQACQEALNALKYFYEDASEYYIACAGSLLGITLTQGFPVGKVDFIEMGPMSFTEFLIANGDEGFVEYLEELNVIEPIPDAFFNPLLEKLKMYFIVGGMPEAVLVWSEDMDIHAAQTIQNNILESYQSDFGKHAPVLDVPKIKLIWDSLPSQLAKENKKFLYSVVKNGARAREYENALNWLNNANLLYKVFRNNEPGLPLSAYDDLNAFKIYMGDVGLLRQHANIPINAFLHNRQLFTEFKGSLTENYVLQSLLLKYKGKIRYWTDHNYEVDFVIQNEQWIIPIEVKVGENIKSTSLKKYMEKYEDVTPIGISFSLRNLSYDGKILNVPLFMIDQLDKLLSLIIK